MDRVDEIVKHMASQGEVQTTQTAFRLALVDRWQIPAGARVLEIGCGQGDMTAALAYSVGPKGSVLAVDIASREYGSPLNLGQSTDHLMGTPLGRNIEFRFNFDLLNPIVSFDRQEFDFVVLTHSAWYFPSMEDLRRVLERVRPWSKRLCFSEWDLEATNPGQMSHLVSILIQGQIEAYRRNGDGNVRTPFSREKFLRMLPSSGWTLHSVGNIDSTGLQDGAWEVDMALRNALKDADAVVMPQKLKDLVESEVDILKGMAERSKPRALASYAVLAV